MNSELIEWGVAERRMPGETLSGDLHLVKPLENSVLVAVADGLGHGKAAAEASRLALETVEQCSHRPLAQVLEDCNRSLLRTRGAVMSLALLNATDNSMAWVGVGNVAGVLVRTTRDGKPAKESLLSSSGVVGGKLPPLRVAALKIESGDTLVLATDGIRRGFEDGIVLFDRAERTAQGILARDGVDTDDALVLVATFQGRPR
ncbi:MAG TPA: SpoIIE family protein phosphatase [Terriglobia bacterium]|nr:SpoIIE family protein phosphatase [Terriglobia bacterium]